MIAASLPSTPGLEKVKAHLAGARILPIVTLDDSAKAADLAQAILRGGIRIMEITLRTPSALVAIRKIAENCPDILVGAGTILEPDQIREVMDAGARFGLAPGLDQQVWETALQEDFVMIPGVMTPSESVQAMRWGCSLQKFFPAEAAGGPAFLRALEGPLAHRGVRYIPTGGVTNGNLRGYLGLKSVVAAGGSWMVSPPLVKKGDWDGITELVEEAVQVAALGGAFSKDASPV